MSMDKVENLGTREQEELLRWFLHWMPMDRRGELMGKMPVTYAKLFPGVDPAAIQRNVEAELRRAAAEMAGPDDRTDYDRPWHGEEWPAF